MKLSLAVRGCAAALSLALGTGASLAQTELTIATVNNGHMIEMQKLTKNFESANPGIKVNWVTLEEGILRQRVTTGPGHHEPDEFTGRPLRAPSTGPSLELQFEPPRDPSLLRESKPIARAAVFQLHQNRGEHPELGPD